MVLHISDQSFIRFYGLHSTDIRAENFCADLHQMVGIKPEAIIGTVQHNREMQHGAEQLALFSQLIGLLFQLQYTVAIFAS